MEMTVWSALGFIGMGVLFAEFYEYRMWRRYQQGKRESRRDEDGRIKSRG